MEAPVITFPRTVEDVFKDYKARRAALLNALTADVEEFFRKCDPEKDNLCLYGFPNETWEVNLPAEEVPPELPEPALGINFARDGMHRRDWLSLVAAHSDAWLMAVAFYFGARFEKNERMHLFSVINELPTVFDVVTGRRAKERVNNNNAPIRNNYPGKTQLAERKARNTKPPQSQEQEDSTDDDDDDDDVGNDDDDANEDDHENDHDDGDDYDAEHGDTACGSCGGRYTDDEFWIGCDICEGWFHGRCVKVTPARAEHIKQYKCPSCTSKRARV